jgi:plastocyanin
MPITDSPHRHLASARRALLLTIGGVAAALVLAACGSDTPSDTGDASPPADETTSAAPEAGGATIEVSESEFSIKLSKSSMKPGDYTFAISNDGNFPHNLAIKGPGIGGETSDTFDGGQSGDLAVTLQEGTYTLWCAVGNHRAQGMETTIEVTG